MTKDLLSLTRQRSGRRNRRTNAPRPLAVRRSLEARAVTALRPMNEVELRFWIIAAFAFGAFVNGVVQ